MEGREGFKRHPGRAERMLLIFKKKKGSGAFKVLTETSPTTPSQEKRGDGDLEEAYSTLVEQLIIMMEG